MSICRTHHTISPYWPWSHLDHKRCTDSKLFEIDESPVRDAVVRRRCEGAVVGDVVVFVVEVDPVVFVDVADAMLQEFGDEDWSRVWNPLFFRRERERVEKSGSEPHRCAVMTRVY